MSENAEIIKKFLNDKNNKIIYGINIDEQKCIFYQAFVKTILSLNGALLKKVDDIKDILIWEKSRNNQYFPHCYGCFSTKIILDIKNINHE